MRITLAIPGTTIVLSDFGTTSVSGLDLDQERQVQVSESVRAYAVQALPRQNRATTLGFSVTRQHANAAAAASWLVGHEATIPDTGLLTMIGLGASGQRVERYLANAVLTSIRGKIIGVSTIQDYRFTGGSFSPTKPT